MAKKKDDPVSLDTMLGTTDDLIQGKKYEIKTIPLKHVKEYLDDQLSIGPQLFNLANEEAKEKLDKWVKRLIFLQGKPQSLEDLMDAEWDLADLRNAMRKAVDLSG